MLRPDAARIAFRQALDIFETARRARGRVGPDPHRGAGSRLQHWRIAAPATRSDLGGKAGIKAAARAPSGPAAHAGNRHEIPDIAYRLGHADLTHRVGSAGRAGRPVWVPALPPRRVAADQPARSGRLADLDGRIQRAAGGPGRAASAVGRAVPGRAATGGYLRGARRAGRPRRVALGLRPRRAARRQRGRDGGVAVHAHPGRGDVPGAGGRGGRHDAGHPRRVPPPGQRDPADLEGVHPGRAAGPAGAERSRLAAAVRLPSVLRGHGQRGAGRHRARPAAGPAGAAGSCCTPRTSRTA